MDNPISALENSDRTCIRVWAALCVVLLVFTWKLWIPGFTDFPRVPILMAFDGPALFAVQYAATVLMTVGLWSLIVGVSRYRLCSGAIAISLLVLFFSNQHCLQPWAWQAFIVATLLACLPIEDAKKWIARVLISVYLYSAIGKFDFQFMHSLGQEFLELVLTWVGQFDLISTELKPKLTLIFPIGELLVAVGLLFSRSRILAGSFAIGLHLVLMLILSPIGMDHRWPVVIWNGMSILLVVWLFLLASRPAEHHAEEQTIAGKIAVAFAIVILVGPMLRPMQLWDHWLAWGLYSPSNSRVEIFVADSAWPRLSDAETKYLTGSGSSFGSSGFDFGQWSLNELGVPIYPQARFQKGVAFKWLRKNELTEFAKVVEFGQSNPWTGERSRTVVALPDR